MRVMPLDGADTSTSTTHVVSIDDAACDEEAKSIGFEIYPAQQQHGNLRKQDQPPAYGVTRAPCRSGFKYQPQRSASSMHLKPMRHSLKRSSSNLWANLFRRGSTQNMSRVSIQRFVHSHRLHTLALLKRQLLPWSITLCLVSLAVLCAHLTLRGNAAETDEDDYGEGGHVGSMCDSLRAVELGLTAAMLLLQGRYHSLHRKTLLIVVRTPSEWHHFYATTVLQLLSLCVGVLPPGVDAKVNIALTSEAAAEGAPPVWLHIDCYCLLQLLVRPALAVLWVTIFLSPQVASPAVLAWQHPECCEHVHTLFRVKYFFTRHCLAFIGVATFLVWSCGSFAMFIVDPLFISMWSAFYDGWILLIDAPPRTPHTVRARPHAHRRPQASVAQLCASHVLLPVCLACAYDVRPLLPLGNACHAGARLHDRHADELLRRALGGDSDGRDDSLRRPRAGRGAAGANAREARRGAQA